MRNWRRTHAAILIGVCALAAGGNVSRTIAVVAIITALAADITRHRIEASA